MTFAISEEYLPYIESFLEETAEQLQTLEEKLVSLERNPDDSTCLNDIFRVAHNLKGNAAMIGFEEMSVLAHHMENLLDQMRRGKICPSDRIIDTLLTCLDALRGLTDEICGKKRCNLDLANLVNELEYLVNNEQTIDITTQDHSTSEPEYSVNNEQTEGISADLKEENELLIVLEESCNMKAARAYVALQTLKELVYIVNVEPSIDTIQNADFEGTEIKVQFFTKESLDTIKEALQAIPEVKEVRLNEKTIKEEEILKIKVDSRLNPQAIEECLREKRAGKVVLDLTSLCELSPAGLNWLFGIYKLNNVELILPEHPIRKRFFELLGFKITSC